MAIDLGGNEQPEVIITFKGDKVIKETKGFKGGKCVEATKFIEELDEKINLLNQNEDKIHGL